MSPENLDILKNLGVDERYKSGQATGVNWPLCVRRQTFSWALQKLDSDSRLPNVSATSVRLFTGL